MTIRVALAEDSFIVREALMHLIEGEDGLDVVAVCSDGSELRSTIDEQRIDVVLTDICMPPSMSDEGLQIANALRTSHPDVGVILLSAYCEAAYAIALLEGGSERRGYLLKDGLQSGRQLTATIESVASGGSVIDPKVVRSLVEARERPTFSPLAGLNLRERQILLQMATGDSNAAIARRVSLPKRSVEKHINTIFAKLSLPPAPDVSRRVLAVLMYLSETRPQQRAATTR